MFGATGFTGREVVRLACEQGHNVVAHVRPDSPKLSYWKNIFESYGAKIDTTPWNVKSLTDTLTKIKPDRVFSLLGTTKAREKKEKLSTYEIVDYGMTKMIADALTASKLNPIFIYLSSLGSSNRAQGAYLKTRWKTEEYILKSNLPYLIARPSFISGNRDEERLMEKIGVVVIDGLLSGIGMIGAKKLQKKYQSTTNTKLAMALINLAMDSKNANRVVESDELQNI